MCDFASHFSLTNWQGVYNFTTFDGISWLFAFRHTPCTGCIGFEYGFKKWGESIHTNGFFSFVGGQFASCPHFLFVWHMALLNVLHFVHLSFYLENFHEFEIACNFSSYFHSYFHICNILTLCYLLFEWQYFSFFTEFFYILRSSFIHMPKYGINGGQTGSK